MSEYERIIPYHRRWMLYLLGFFILGFGVTPYRRIFLGLLLGGIVSLLNMVILHNRVRAFTKVIIEGGRAVTLGLIIRFANAGITILFALQFKDKIHIWSVIIGLIISYIVMIVDVFIRSVIVVRTSEKDLQFPKDNEKKE